MNLSQLRKLQRAQGLFEIVALQALCPDDPVALEQRDLCGGGADVHAERKPVRHKRIADADRRQRADHKLYLDKEYTKLESSAESAS